MKQIYEYAIVGAGIAGANIAYLLNKAGKKVIVLEKESVASGGSGAAGAFLSPKICSNSSYTKFVNEAYSYALEFYKKYFSSHFHQEGIVRFLKNRDDIQKCKNSISSYLPPKKLPFLNNDTRKFGALLFENGGLVESKKLINSLLTDIEVKENFLVEQICYQNNLYEINGIKADTVILCTGKAKEIEELNYLRLKDIYGHRVEVKSKTSLPFVIHKEFSISTNKDSILHIGATHIPSYKMTFCEKELERMIDRVKEYMDFDGFEIQKVHFGKRNATFDFFPVIGNLINSKKTLQRYPYIIKGSKVPKEKFIYHPRMYVFSGVGARGFVLSPLLAKILFENIIKKAPIPFYLDTHRLFLRYARSIK